MANVPQTSPPTMANATAFRCKVLALQARRFAQNVIFREAARHRRVDRASCDTVIAESVTSLWSDSEAEWALQAGKVHNLRAATRALHGIEVPAGATFSFWKQVGRPARRKDYAAGRELREGCMIPSVGGGICQLSNALYDAALNARFTIVERHAHNRVVPGSQAEIGRDATVFWNHVDLRFKSSVPFRIEAMLSATQLIVRFKGASPVSTPDARSSARRVAVFDGQVHDCATCGIRGCFRGNTGGDAAPALGRTAFLVNDYWPEFHAYINESRRAGDVLGIPHALASRGGWIASAECCSKRALMAGLRRSLALRWAGSGARRQRALAIYVERLARSYRSLLAWDVQHVVVSLDLLPYLWRAGDLGGRTFDVLMTRHPLRRLHGILDFARRLHQESRTLGEYRADETLVRSEGEALQAARRVIAPHRDVAADFHGRTILLDWHEPATNPAVIRGGRVIFLGPTAGRRGAFEMKSAAHRLKCELGIVGSELEGEDFWRGVLHRRIEGGSEWLTDAAVVVAPAFVEHQPRRLLQAIARGVPVIATPACGLGDRDGVITIPAGNEEALVEAIQRICRSLVARVPGTEGTTRVLRR